MSISSTNVNTNPNLAIANQRIMQDALNREANTAINEATATKEPKPVLEQKAKAFVDKHFDGNPAKAFEYALDSEKTAPNIKALVNQDPRLTPQIAVNVTEKHRIKLLGEKLEAEAKAFERNLEDQFIKAFQKIN